MYYILLLFICNYVNVSWIIRSHISFFMNTDDEDSLGMIIVNFFRNSSEFLSSGSEHCQKSTEKINYGRFPLLVLLIILYLHFSHFPLSFWLMIFYFLILLYSILPPLYSVLRLTSYKFHCLFSSPPPPPNSSAYHY